MAELQLDADALNAVLSKFVGKDKILRFVQYLCRFNKGVFQSGLVPLEGEDLKFAMAKNWKLFVVLMNARRTYRLLNSVPTLLKLRKGIVDKPWGENLHPAYVISQWMMALWPAIDHYRFLVLVTWATKGTQAEVRNFSYRIFAAAQLIICAAQFSRGYMVEKKEWDSKSAKTARWNCVKAGLTALTIGHVSQFPGLTTNELICGGTGVATSLMDLYNMWPKVQPGKKTDEDAEARFLGTSTAVLLATLASVSFIRSGGMK